MLNPVNGGSALGPGTFNTTSLTTSNAPMTAGSLRFPADLGEGNFNHWMSFTFYEYERPSISYWKNGYQTVALQDRGTIRLPIPNTMIDHQDQDYNVESLMTTLAGYLNINSQRVDQLFGLGGYATNPLMGVMYKSPSFKSHRFSWRLAPSNEKESIYLNTIINNFRANQLPASRGPLLRYPSIVQVTVSNNDPNKFTYAFKPAIIRSLEVNFAPEGIPSFFHDPSGQGKTAPTAVELRMELLEIEFWVQQDYGLGQFDGMFGLPSGTPAPQLPGEGPILNTVFGAIGNE